MTGIKNIGFIGIGNMGVPMALHLVAAGFRVMVYDIDGDRARKFASEHSATGTASLAELGATSDLVVTMLPSGRDVRQVLFEAQDGALAASLQPPAIVIDMSSADPVGTRRIGADLAARGIRFVDAPVSGGVKGARDATLAIMIGGETGTIAAVKPVLACLGSRLIEVGGLGCGHAMKALNNFLAGTAFAAMSEAIAVGRRFGLDPAVMSDVLNASTGRSFATENLLKQHVLSGSFATGFSLRLLAKDVKIAADLANQMNVETPVCGLVSALWEEAREKLGNSPDHSRAAVYWDQRKRRPEAE